MGPGKGRMLGVLLGVDYQGKRAILQAYSGTSILKGLWSLAFGSLTGHVRLRLRIRVVTPDKEC